MDEHVGGRLRRRRIARGLSQDALAKILGVSFQQLHKYETGENRISVSRLYQLCLVLDVPLDWLFEGLPGASERKPAVRLPSAVPFELGSSTGETMVLLRAYQQIDNPRARELLLSLAMMLAESSDSRTPSLRSLHSRGP